MNDHREPRRVRGRRAGRPAVALALGLIVALTGCASMQQEQIAYSPVQLRERLVGQLGPSRAADVVVPYEVSSSLVERARELTEGVSNDYEKARMLLRAVTREDGFGLRYEPVATTAADATVHRGYGNCLSLASFYVGLARGIGLTAYFVDASDRVNDIRREERLIVDSGHVAAVVHTSRGYSTVDFDGELTNYRTFRVIDDVEALAHFYNNSGYELIHQVSEKGEEVPWRRVAERFELAVRVRPAFARAHNNLGVAYAHLGDRAKAERHYRAAIAADDEFAAPHHNLGNVHARDEEWESALAAYDRAVELQPHNPYLHYHRGVALYSVQEFERAVESLREAISLKHDYREPRTLLAQTYRRLGRHGDAEELEGD